MPGIIGKPRFVNLYLYGMIFRMDQISIFFNLCLTSAFDVLDLFSVRPQNKPAVRFCRI